MEHRWGMAIDLDRWTGCEACVVACAAENNVPTTDPRESSRGRAIHWIRVDRYYEGEFPNVRVKYMPVLCQQCEQAPCEPVCPVYATYQNPEGLNVQVYNRCVGTFYCANICPYTVRSFNFFEPKWDAPLECTIRMSPCARAVLWKNAHSASSESREPKQRRKWRESRSPTGMCSRPACNPAPRRL